MIFSATNLVAASSTIFKLNASHLLKCERHVAYRFGIEGLTGKKWPNRHCAVLGFKSRKATNNQLYAVWPTRKEEKLQNGSYAAGSTVFGEGRIYRISSGLFVRSRLRIYRCTSPK
jgi:hypothetical protein